MQAVLEPCISDALPCNPGSPPFAEDAPSQARERCMTWDQSPTAPSHPSPITNVPVEILHYIFTLACVDGGTTGCALAQVSRHIRDVSRAARFRIVSLLHGSSRKLQAFVDDFTRAREAAAREHATMPRVHHLCITVAARGSEYVNDTPKPIDNKHLSRGFHISPARAPIPAHEHHRITQNYRAMVQTILARTAADLDSLCFLGPRVFADVDNRLYWFLPLDTDLFFKLQEPEEMPRFVRLRELSLSGDAFKGDYVRTHNMLELGDHDWPMLFPALERIVVTPHDLNNVDIKWWFCVAHAAKVRHLRLVLDCKSASTWCQWYRGVKHFVDFLAEQALRRRVQNDTYRPTLDLSNVHLELIARIHPYLGTDFTSNGGFEAFHLRQDSIFKSIEKSFSGAPPELKYELWLQEGQLSHPYRTLRTVPRPVSADALNIPLDDMLRRDWLQRALSPS